MHNRESAWAFPSGRGKTWQCNKSIQSAEDGFFLEKTKIFHEADVKCLSFLNAREIFGHRYVILIGKKINLNY